MNITMVFLLISNGKEKTNEGFLVDIFTKSSLKEIPRRKSNKITHILELNYLILKLNF